MVNVDKDSDNPNEQENETDQEPQGLGFFQMVGSILSSFLGIQSSKKSKRDFKHGKASQFIAVGILMTIVWYGIISIIVNIVLADR
jgi:Protein of unknown function (DUF2970)